MVARAFPRLYRDARLLAQRSSGPDQARDIGGNIRRIRCLPFLVVGFRFVMTPSVASWSLIKGVESISSIPSLAARRHAADQRIRVAPRQGPGILTIRYRASRPEYLNVLHLPAMNRLGYAMLLRTRASSQLADTNPCDHIRNLSMADRCLFFIATRRRCAGAARAFGTGWKSAVPAMSPYFII